MCNACDPDSLDLNCILLDCSGCDKIETLPDNLSNLKFLTIYDTKIKEIPVYEALEGLYCMNCPIEHLPDLPKLRKLNASNTNLKEISDSLFRLEHLIINDTNIKTIPDTMISLKQLNVNRSGVKDVSSKLINLESLSINGCPVDKLNPLMSLQYLDCSNTNIRVIKVKYFPSLRKVQAKGCTFDDPFALIEKGIDLFN